MIPESLRLGLLTWAEAVMRQRPPDFTVGDRYMERWRLAEYGGPNCYLHRFRGDDDDKALHDHPYDNVTVVLRGGYLEHFHRYPLEVASDDKYMTVGYVRGEGEVVQRSAATMHRVQMLPGVTEAITLFTTGERIRDWGFMCPDAGWVDWRTYGADKGDGRQGKCP